MALDGMEEENILNDYEAPNIPKEDTVDNTLDEEDIEFQDPEVKILAKMVNKLSNQQEINARGLLAAIETNQSLEAKINRTNKQLLARATILDKSAEGLSIGSNKSPEKNSSKEDFQVNSVNLDEIAQRAAKRIDIPELQISKFMKQLKKLDKSNKIKNTIIYILLAIAVIGQFVDFKSAVEKLINQVIDKKIYVVLKKDTEYRCETVNENLIFQNDTKIEGKFKNKLFVFDVNSDGNIYKCYALKKYIKEM